jgi:plastocyanin
VRNRFLLARLAAVIAATGVFAATAFPAGAQQKAVTVHVRVQKGQAGKSQKPAGPLLDASEVVVWLTPLDPPGPESPSAAPAGKRLQLVQKNKSFQPHLVVVRKGSVVDFPNRDPFFHNVFSLFDGKRFDLGLYEAGATNSVRFDREGVSFLFCNIHPEMSAVVVAVDTPYYGVADRTGKINIENVPDGKYELHVWYERSLPEDLRSLTRTVRVEGDSREVGPISVPLNPSFTASHKNKYGQDYTPPPPTGYGHP